MGLVPDRDGTATERDTVTDVRLRAGFHQLVERHRPLDLSSGLRELIEPLHGELVDR